MCIARSGKDSEVTRPARLSWAVMLSAGREDGFRLSKREEWTGKGLVGVVIVGGSGIRVCERWRETAGYVGEWRWRQTMGFLEELRWMGVVAWSWERVGSGWGGIGS